MPKAKQTSLKPNERSVHENKTGDGYTKLSQHFRVSRTGVRSIFKKFKGSHTVQKKSSIKIEGFIKKEGPAVND